MELNVDHLFGVVGILIMAGAVLFAGHWYERWQIAKKGYRWYISYSPRWKRVAAASKRRDKHTCRLCGRRPPRVKLNSHHPPELYNEILYHEKPEDLTTLCEECHEWFSKWWKERRTGLY